ncbi:MAG: peptide/nickel transport system permease protein [Thermomicrobiales bacterium]|nr:peptide/nickel transport system permease protein [Thermomicrobiales bacterium]
MSATAPTRGNAVVSPLAMPGRFARDESPWARAVRRFRRHRLAVAGLVVLVVLSLMAVFAPVVGRNDPNRGDFRRIDLKPSWEYPLGTDGNGRDYWSRLVYGARVSLSVGLVATAIAGGIGTLLGAVSGYYRGSIDLAIQRFTDMVMTFPSLIIIVTLVAYVGPSIYNIMIILGLLGWTSFCRVVRGQVLSVREVAFVEAARTLGARDHTILFRHILPNVLPYIVVLATLNIAGIILIEAGLSFLGLGVQVPTASWGNMLQQAQSLDVLVSKPWRWIAPGAAIALCVLAINFVGDGLHDALDPRSKID